jgi:hypothetical protein
MPSHSHRRPLPLPGASSWHRRSRVITVYRVDAALALALPVVMTGEGPNGRSGAEGVLHTTCNRDPSLACALEMASTSLSMIWRVPRALWWGSTRGGRRPTPTLTANLWFANPISASASHGESKQHHGRYGAGAGTWSVCGRSAVINTAQASGDAHRGGTAPPTSRF